MAKKPPDKLSIESSKAIAAGMSYGKWKALHGDEVTEEEKKVTEDVLLCKYCGNPIYDDNGIGRGRKYCTRTCADKAYYQSRKESKKKLAAGTI